MMTLLIFAVSFWGMFLITVDSANILALNTVSSHSHAIYANVLTRALAAKGHKIVVLSPDEERDKNPNITTFFLEGGYDDYYDVKLDDMPSFESAMDSTFLVFAFSENLCRRLLSSEGNKQFYREYKTHQFDLILMDIGTTECFLKYAQVFGNPPIVTYSAFFSIQPYNLGNFDHPAYVPHFTTTLTDRMTFTERLSNWFQYHFYNVARRYWYLPKLDKISEEFFGFYEPTMQELEDRIQLMLTNEHFSITHPKPMVPATIPVGGLHIKPPKPLPQDIEKFVADAKHGVIFFSLGSNFLSKQISDERKQMFLEAFAQLPQKVLWKYEDDALKNIPQNVLVRKWFPQTDILGHNNTILFMTHNGYLSTLESIYFGIPMIGIPLMLDQFKNNVKIIKKGLGLRMTLGEIESSAQILNTIKTILNNPSFRENAQRTSTFYRDRPMAPLDTAIYWIEYVLRHKGAEQLRVASLDLTWYQYYLLDIYATIAASIFTVYYILAKLISAVFNGGEKQKQS